MTRHHKKGKLFPQQWWLSNKITEQYGCIFCYFFPFVVLSSCNSTWWKILLHTDCAISNWTEHIQWPGHSWVVPGEKSSWRYHCTKIRRWEADSRVATAKSLLASSEGGGTCHLISLLFFKSHLMSFVLWNWPEYGTPLIWLHIIPICLACLHSSPSVVSLCWTFRAEARSLFYYLESITHNNGSILLLLPPPPLSARPLRTSDGGLPWIPQAKEARLAGTRERALYVVAPLAPEFPSQGGPLGSNCFVFSLVPSAADKNVLSWLLPLNDVSLF